MTDLTAVGAPTAGPPPASEVAADRPSADELERHRRELTAHCLRLLESTADAEDAAQETLMRAWCNLDRFEGRASLRTWLHRIATHVCFDMVDGRRRRPLPIDLVATRTAEVAVAATLPRTAWMASAATAGHSPTSPAADDPAEAAVAREAIRQAFVAVLQRLPARQRAVLILREVLRWQAAEVAELLGTTIAAVNSALQRARATLVAAHGTATATREPPGVLDRTQQELLARYLDAFERHDVPSLVALLHGG